MTLFTIVVTGHHSYSAIISYMPEFPTLETLPIITLAVYHMMPHLTALEALHGRTKIPPTRLVPTTRSLIILIIRFPTIHLLLTFPINIPQAFVRVLARSSSRIL